MKKVALIIVLLVLVAAAAGAAIPNDDTDFRTGLKSYNSKNYKAAITYFKEYINKKPDPTAYYLIGYSLYKLGKFREADAYFREAYLIDPEYSLEKVGLIKKASGEVVAKEPALGKKPDPALEKKELKPVSSSEIKAAQSAPKKPEPAAIPAQTGVKKAQPAKSAQTASAEQKAKASKAVPAAAPVKKSATPAQSSPQQAVPTPPALATPPVPMPVQMPNVAGPTALLAMIAALGMILVFIGIAVYIYSSLCLFLIAKKLEVEAPWTAWIPIVQIWTFVVSAGKPGWWVFLFLVPIVNLFVGIYLWMCISENLGKNKWLGLLILVPLIGIFYPGWLAFSKTERSGGYTPPEETLAE
jgi:hypothetical protein